MRWYVVTIAPDGAGDAIAAHVLRRANNPATWSTDSAGAIVLWQKQGDADLFYFCPKAAMVFQPLISTNDGRTCDLPPIGASARARSSRLVLGGKTHWEGLAEREGFEPSIQV